jgi:copper chaperone
VPMLSFTVPNISCGHCARAVTEAITQAAPQAQVQVDIPTRRVQVQTSAARALLVQALSDAGYRPDAPAADDPAAAAATG